MLEAVVDALPEHALLDAGQVLLLRAHDGPRPAQPEWRIFKMCKMCSQYIMSYFVIQSGVVGNDFDIKNADCEIIKKKRFLIINMHGKDDNSDLHHAMVSRAVYE